MNNEITFDLIKVKLTHHIPFHISTVYIVFVDLSVYIANYYKIEVRY